MGCFLELLAWNIMIEEKKKNAIVFAYRLLRTKQNESL